MQYSAAVCCDPSFHSAILSRDRRELQYYLWNNDPRASFPHLVTRLSKLLRLEFQARLWRICLVGVLAYIGLLAAMPGRAAEITGNGGDGLLPLTPGDAVSVEVFGQADMTTTVYVGKDGAIRVPLAGTVQVAGLTAVEAAQRVEQALKDGEYLKDPHVTITVVRSTSQQVSVLGEVHAPGQYEISGRTTLLDILARAGGLTEDSADIIFILQPESGGTISRHAVNVRALMNRDTTVPSQTLLGGDSILVPRAQYFYIQGEINKPDKYRLEDDTTVLQAIALAGGVTAKGSSRRIDIKRLGKDGKYVSKHARGSDLIEPDDVIQVKESIF
jgi:polysaccharide export outer membrane protein